MEFDLDKTIDKTIDETTQEENVEIKKTLHSEKDKEYFKKLLKWSTTNVKNISNYEQELNLLTNEELITILKTSKTNIKTNKIIENEALELTEYIDSIKSSSLLELIKKMNKYYLICIGLGLIQKKIVSEKIASLNYKHIDKEVKKLKNFKQFLLDYNTKQSELSQLIEFEDYFEKVKKAIGASKK